MLYLRCIVLILSFSAGAVYHFFLCSTFILYQSRIILGFKIGRFWLYETKKRKRARERLNIEQELKKGNIVTIIYSTLDY